MNDAVKFPLRTQTPPPEPEFQEDRTPENYVEKIVDHRRHNRLEYRVRLSGYPPDEDTWDTASTLHKARHLIKIYENSLQPRQTNSIQTEQLATASTVVNPDRIVESHQCKAFTNQGNRCKDRTPRSKYCQPHLSQLKNLHITSSKIRDAGLGMFSSRVARLKNTIITDYEVQVIVSNQS